MIAEERFSSGVERSDIYEDELSREADLRAERLASGAEI
jgi:hypothetical protein